MPDERNAEQIQRDIEQSRVALAAAVDQLAYRGSPKRIVDRAKEKAQSPAGRAVLAAAGGVVIVLVVLRVRKR